MATLGRSRDECEEGLELEDRQCGVMSSSLWDGTHVGKAVMSKSQSLINGTVQDLLKYISHV